MVSLRFNLDIDLIQSDLTTKKLYYEAFLEKELEDDDLTEQMVLLVQDIIESGLDIDDERAQFIYDWIESEVCCLVSQIITLYIVILLFQGISKKQWIRMEMPKDSFAKKMLSLWKSQSLLVKYELLYNGIEKKIKDDIYDILVEVDRTVRTEGNMDEMQSEIICNWFERKQIRRNKDWSNLNMTEESFIDQIGPLLNDSGSANRENASLKALYSGINNVLGEDDDNDGNEDNDYEPTVSVEENTLKLVDIIIGKIQPPIPPDQSEIIVDWFKNNVGPTKSKWITMRMTKQTFIDKIFSLFNEEDLLEPYNQLYAEIVKEFRGEMANMVDLIIDNMPALQDDREMICSWIDKKEVKISTKKEWKHKIRTEDLELERFMTVQKFVDHLMTLLSNKELQSSLMQLYYRIEEMVKKEGNDDEKDEEFIHEMRSDFSLENDANSPTDDEYEYRDFVVWCEDSRNVQHRLRHLTFVICKYLNQCQPSIIEV